MKTPLTHWQVAEETVKLSPQHDRPGTAAPRELNQTEPDEASSNQFADKLRLLQSYCRHAHFILHRRRRGKLARLPGPIREQVNFMLRDGLPYNAIIARLGEAGKHLNKDNLSRWRKADYQDWLAQQTWLEMTANRPETLPGLKDVALLLHQMAPDTLRAAAARNRNAFVRLCNFAARAAGLSVESSPRPCLRGCRDLNTLIRRPLTHLESNQMIPNVTKSNLFADKVPPSPPTIRPGSYHWTFDTLKRKRARVPAECEPNSRCLSLITDLRLKNVQAAAGELHFRLPS